jgi:hypothetical protein
MRVALVTNSHLAGGNDNTRKDERQDETFRGNECSCSCHNNDFKSERSECCEMAMRLGLVAGAKSSVGPRRQSTTVSVTQSKGIRSMPKKKQMAEGNRHLIIRSKTKNKNKTPKQQGKKQKSTMINPAPHRTRRMNRVGST